MTPKVTPVAFAHYSVTTVIIRLAGAVPRAGIYVFPDGVTLATVIKMTHVAEEDDVSNHSILSRQLSNGDIVEVSPRKQQHVEIIVNTMKTQERTLLGIPLDPDRMDAADWEALPGIGPALARVIITDRQKNGVFGSLQTLHRVPGMGQKKILAVKKFF